MNTEETKDKGKKAGCADFTTKFKGMFEGMSRCCTGQEGSIDCSAMMNGMMKEMMEKCCGTRTENIKTGDRSKKEGVQAD